MPSAAYQSDIHTHGCDQCAKPAVAYWVHTADTLQLCGRHHAQHSDALTHTGWALERQLADANA